MFFRVKASGARRYLQIVEGYRDQGRVRQRVLATLGRLDLLQSSGQLDSLLASGVKFSEKVSLLGEHKAGTLGELHTQSIGPGLLFGRLWKETGMERCLQELLARRWFRFDVAAAVLLSVVHRLVDSGSDRAADKWRRDYLLEGTEKLTLRQLYRAMAWLGEELTDDEQAGATAHARRCVKDQIEERLFEQRRTLFSDAVVAFFDTTSLYFEGAAATKLGRRGKSKDHRPDLRQMVAGLVIDGAGRPICCELWPGNTADVTTLLPVLGRLQSRFEIRSVLIVADRGMISAETLAALEQRKDDVRYILGARLRKQKEVNAKVLSRAGRYRIVRGPRQRRKDPEPLRVKEVWVEERRYVVCFNPERARSDAQARERIVEKLRKALGNGDRSLVGNAGFRKYLKSSGPKFEVDEQRVRKEARLDGKYVLRTNSELSSAEVALTYKQLWMVESLFRTVKSVLQTRPIHHHSDAAIRGHVFCSFLALVLMRELQDRMEARGWGEAEWDDVIRDLDRLDQTQAQAADGKRFLIRSEVKGWCGKAFQACGVAIPPTVRRIEPPGPQS